MNPIGSILKVIAESKLNRALIHIHVIGSNAFTRISCIEKVEQGHRATREKKQTNKLTNKQKTIITITGTTTKKKTY